MLKPDRKHLLTWRNLALTAGAAPTQSYDRDLAITQFNLWFADVHIRPQGRYCRYHIGDDGDYWSEEVNNPPQSTTEQMQREEEDEINGVNAEDQLWN